MKVQCVGRESRKLPALCFRFLLYSRQYETRLQFLKSIQNDQDQYQVKYECAVRRFDQGTGTQGSTIRPETRESELINGSHSIAAHKDALPPSTIPGSVTLSPAFYLQIQSASTGIKAIDELNSDAVQFW